ncbi:MAG: acyl-CoA dehydratase activase [bacterium]|nr:acyl-CoA dehydratase activase [bacterium]
MIDPGMNEARGSLVLGIDVGSIAASIVALDPLGAVILESYALHHGDVRGTLRTLAAPLDFARVRAVAATASAAGAVVSARVCEATVAGTLAARRLHRTLDALLIVGGEKFHLVRFAPDGGYEDSRGSSPCAAGTGSFLDQQARRLGFEGSAAISRAALGAAGPPPKIASRCSVFAKTDLIHAQQQGYSLAAICDGLCQGLAANVVDTLFGGREDPAGLIVFAGGVSRNEAVRRHLEALLGRPLVVDEHSHVYGSLGAALLLAGEIARGEAAGLPVPPRDIEELLRPVNRDRPYAHPPLELRESRYPDFSAGEHYVFSPVAARGAAPVEVDVFRPLPGGGRLRAFLGIDVGSTSTKAVLLEAGRGPDAGGAFSEDRIVAGFYTRTAGQPLIATQGIFESIEALARERGIRLDLAGAATTGSGRKLIGAIIGADEIIDEITAHARAAVGLDPEVDTIIEIGGQDAKFTTLDAGRVTLSIMNNVCAAGTGSFIEEQANRLGVPLEDCAPRTRGRSAPLTSDCCTVFMERDINHYLASAYAVDEVLAAALHAICENYLRKVARESAIGRRVCFQGATAKNRSLVAAFEERLGKPIIVSRYCHLTGALGAAWLLAAEPRAATGFRGLGLCREPIPVEDETCALCRNHCKLKVATVGRERVAYGMLCGRDYEAERCVPVNKSGFDLYRVLREHYAFEAPPPRRKVTIGLLAGVCLHEDLALWRRFFAALGVPTVTTEGEKDVVSLGQRLAGASFCAPIAAFHGHAAKLAEKADFIFAPFYLEDDDRPPGARRQYCYYSQFAGCLAATIPGEAVRSRLLMPVVKNRENLLTRIARLHEALRPALGPKLSLREVERAYREARRYAGEKRAALPGIMRAARAEAPDGLAVVLLGRPYTVLSASMNKGIPDLFAAMGVRCFAQSMVEVGEADRAAVAPLLAAVHWAYPAQTLAAAEAVSQSPGLYPVIITSFKCAPDSCTLESLRRIFDRRGKPYLILQLDEHDSQVGYETRIEAALRSFRNHHARPPRPEAVRTPLRVNPDFPAGLRGRTVLLPCWDRYACTLMAASFRHEGIDAHVLEEDALLITKALQRNSGQCIPLSIMVEDSVAYITRHDLDPARATLWIMDSQIGCNIGAAPLVMQGLFETHGRGFEESRVYSGQITGSDVSLRAVVNQYLVFLCAGNLRRMGCRIRPYEVRAGETGRVLEESLALLAAAFEAGREILPVVRAVVDRLAAIETRPGTRPKVALFGDLYARDNDVFNQGLIARIEAEGGEAVTTPYTEYTRMIAGAYLQKWVREGKYKLAAEGGLVLAGGKVIERHLLREFERVLGPPPRFREPDAAEVLAPYRVTTQHTGESFDNLLKIHHLLAAYPDIALFAQLSPAFCCPSLVTEAMTHEIRRRTGVPVVTITYDGTRSAKNDIIAPYLYFLRERAPGA